MKRIISLLVILTVTAAAFAQNPVLRQRLELAEVEVDDGDAAYEVFRMEDNGQYYLSVGHLGIGNEVIQVQFDPIFELFIPLGGTLSEAILTMNKLKALYKESPGTDMHINGCLSAAYPNDNWEDVTVTFRKMLLKNVLDFSVKRDGYIRAAYITKSEFNSLLASLKLYSKIHPKEQ